MPQTKRAGRSRSADTSRHGAGCIVTHTPGRSTSMQVFSSGQDPGPGRGGRNGETRVKLQREQLEE
jgi:hypothetical protein